MNKQRSFIFGASAKKYWLSCSLILTLVGQSLIRESRPLNFFRAITEFTINWDKTFYLGFINPTNIIVGLLLIILSSIIFSQLIKSLGKLNSIQDSFLRDNNWLFQKKYILPIITNLSVYMLVMSQLVRHRYSNLIFWIWLINIIVFSLIFWKNELENKAGAWASFSYLDIAWMLILFTLAIIAGSYLLNEFPAKWIPDEGPFWILARSIALGEKEPSFFDSGVFTFPVASSILQGLIMRWAGVNMWGWRFASVLPAALTVIPLYLLVQELFDRRTAITTNVMMIANPYFLTFARLGYNNSQSLFPVTLCVYFLVLGFRKSNRFYLWLAGLAAGLGFYTYFAAWLGLVVIVIAIIGISVILRVKFQKIIFPLAIIIVGTLVVFLPRVLFGLSGNSSIALHYKLWESGPITTFYATQLFGGERVAQSQLFILDDIEVFYNLPLYGILLIRGIVLSAAVLFDPIGYNEHHIILGLAGPGSSLFFVLGLGVLITNFRKLQYFIPSIWFLAGFFFLGALASVPPRPTHMVAIIPVLAFISAIGLVTFLDTVTNPDSAQLESTRHLKNISASGVLAILATMGFFQFFFMIPFAYSPINQDDYISWLGRQIPTNAHIILIDQDPITSTLLDDNLIKLSQHHISFLTRSNLELNPNEVKTWINFVAFIDPKNGRVFAEWIANQIPSSIVQVAYVPGGRVRGYIVTDIQVKTSMDISISYGLRDLWNSPARTILISCGVVLIALLLRQFLRYKTYLDAEKS